MNDRYEEIYRRMQEILAGKGSCVVSIDGRCGSGKSTLAQMLKEKFNGEVIHMDDFFLRPEQRTAERYASPGENVDHERFLEEVLIPLRAGKDFTYYPFDCDRMQVSDQGVMIRANAVVIIEGSYSQRNDLRPYYDLTVFLTVDPEEQMRRIIARNPAKEEAFRTRWIPLEEAYFEAYDIERKAQIVIQNQ